MSTNDAHRTLKCHFKRNDTYSIKLTVWNREIQSFSLYSTQKYKLNDIFADPNVSAYKSNGSKINEPILPDVLKDENIIFIEGVKYSITVTYDTDIKIKKTNNLLLENGEDILKYHIKNYLDDSSLFALQETSKKLNDKSLLTSEYDYHKVPPNMYSLITKLNNYNGSNLYLFTSLTSLSFSEEYNQRFDVGVLSSSLTSLSLGKYYNQPFGVGVLPSSLTSLSLGYNYNQPFGVGVFPSSLKSLSLYQNYSHPIDVNLLPKIHYRS